VAALLDSVPPGARFTAARERIRSQPGIRDQFLLGLQRAGRYQETLEAVLDSLRVPREIACLPHVESSFHPGAVSKAGAVGLWQFMPATGRRFLRVQSDLDERLDPIRATEAAARYLLAAREELGSWALAVVSYNHGVAGVSRARQATASTEIDRVLLGYDGPGFGFASQNFYCEFLAAIEVSSRPERYFAGEIVPDLPLVAMEYTLPDYVRWPTLARAFGVETEALAALNPAVGPSYRSGRRPLPRGYILRLPVDTGNDLAGRYAEIPASERWDRAPRPEGYRVRPGDTLGAIARRHRIPLRSLLQLNDLRSNSIIRPGQVLVLPDAANPGL
jgi:membrane-bound lytic murein transglycosylase D